MTAIDLATAARRTSNRPGHVRRVEQHALNLTVEQIRSVEAKRKKGRHRMAKILVSVVGMLACIGYAMSQRWFMWQQSVVAIVFVALFVMFMSEWFSD